MNYNWLDNFKGVKADFTPNFSDYGYWAFLDNEDMLVIGEERGLLWSLEEAKELAPSKNWKGSY